MLCDTADMSLVAREELVSPRDHQAASPQRPPDIMFTPTQRGALARTKPRGSTNGGTYSSVYKYLGTRPTISPYLATAPGLTHPAVTHGHTELRYERSGPHIEVFRHASMICTHRR